MQEEGMIVTKGEGRNSMKKEYATRKGGNRAGRQVKRKDGNERRNAEPQKRKEAWK
jgi:hypothetical protein